MSERIDLQPYSADPLTRRALVAETDPATLKLCHETLKAEGFRVESVETGIAAVVNVRDNLPDVIFIASQLRDSTGYEAIEWLRANPDLRSVPIILLAADSEPNTELSHAAPAARLRKPLSPATIRRGIAEFFH